MVGAATVIAVRSSDITKVIGPISRNISRQRRPPVGVVTNDLQRSCRIIADAK
jgi:hypothetical protein